MWRLSFAVLSRKVFHCSQLNTVTLLPRYFSCRNLNCSYWEFDRRECLLSIPRAYIVGTALENRTHSASLFTNYSNRRYSVVAFTTLVATSYPVQQAQNILECIHNATGFAWWSTIITATITLRLLLLPLVVYQNYIIARYENLMPEVKALAEELKKETSLAVKLYKWDEATAKRMFKRSLRKHITSLVVRDNCHPFKSGLIVLFQLPAWFSLSFALRNMSYYLPYLNLEPHITFFEMSVGGTLWFPNLTLPDECFIMPVLLGITNLFITEVHALRRIQKDSKLQKAITNFFRFMSVAIVPIAIMMPSCITLYWLQSSICGLAQNFFLTVPKVRRFFGIPRTPSESQTPFLDIMQNLKLKFKIN